MVAQSVVGDSALSSWNPSSSDAQRMLPLSRVKLSRAPSYGPGYEHRSARARKSSEAEVMAAVETLAVELYF